MKTQWAVAHLPDGTTRGLMITRDPQALLDRMVADGAWPEGTRIAHGDFEGATFRPVATKEEFDRDCENTP